MLASPAPVRARARVVHAPAVVVASTLAFGLICRGGYYPTERQALCALAIGGSAYVLWRAPLRSVALGPAAVGAGGLLVVAALHHQVPAVAATLLLGAAAVLLLMAVESARPEARDAVTLAVVGVGVVVALTGAIGVVRHAEPWALVDQGLWRAASPLTYANAAGAFLAASVAIAIGRAVPRPTRAGAVGICVLVAGLVATASRGGVLAFVAASSVLVLTLGWRRVVSVAVLPVLGGVIAGAGVLASAPADQPARPWLAMLALAAGVALSVLAPCVEARRSLAVLAVGAACAPWGLAHVPGSIRTPRFNLSSDDRRHESASAVRSFLRQPLSGTGLRNLTLTWDEPDGSSRTAEYVHDEYLQTAAELGIVGLGALVGAGLLLGRSVLRARRSASAPELWAAGVAAAVALAVSSAFDFDWHIPLLVLEAAVALGLALPVPPIREDLAC